MYWQKIVYTISKTTCFWVFRLIIYIIFYISVNMTIETEAARNDNLFASNKQYLNDFYFVCSFFSSRSIYFRKWFVLYLCAEFNDFFSSFRKNNGYVYYFRDESLKLIMHNGPRQRETHSIIHFSLYLLQSVLPSNKVQHSHKSRFIDDNIMA